MGSGLPFLGSGELAEGGRVSEAQLQLLVGMGRDPLTGEPLGEAYRQYASVQDRVDQRVSDLDPDLGPVSRAEQVAAIEAEAAERGTRRAVAGYDLTFSVPKSLSAWWGVADAGTQSLIADAHHQAVAEVVAFLEREVATTRVGAAGPGGAVAHVDVAGVLATAFDHYDSRSGDPQLHTHVVVSNKVLTVQDQKWRTLAGRPVHASVVALSELYNATLADRITGKFGIGWEARERGRDRNPAWELAPVPEELVSEFSSRSRQIEEEKTRLIDAYRERHGREPSATTVVKLRAQATLATRPEKQVHSLAELTADWRTRATGLLGEDATGWARTLTASAEKSAVLRADDVPLDTITDLGQAVVAVVGEKRSTWRRWNLHSEASRQLMGIRFATASDREAVTGLVTDAAEQASLRLTPPELASSPVLFRRPDGSSRFRHPSAVLYSTEELLAAEDRLLDRSHLAAGPTVDLATVEKITGRPDADGRRLGPDQAEALQRIAVSGRVVDVLVGPAGAGKTTAMSALKRAWEQQHGRGSVVGLAPSAAAAQVLGEELGIETENTARWWQMHLVRGDTFARGQLVILDEASLAGTGSLDRITGLAEAAGAKVLLVGDWSQLQAVDAGGAFGMLVHDRDDAPELADVHRFTHPWEKTTSLDLRHGRTAAIDTLIEHDRVRGGEQDAMVDAAYAAWREDVRAGRASILVAEARDTVTQLNARARADLTLDGTITPGREVELHDGTRAAKGDRIITRENNRRLRSRNGKAWVRNGDRWTVTNVSEDGSITVRPEGRRFGGGLVLPASYVAEQVELGYAITGHRAQGITVDTSHVVTTATTTRENFYVAMTRGRHRNYAYVATDTTDDAHIAPHPSDNPDATARSVLYGSSTSALSCPRTKPSPPSTNAGGPSRSSPRSTTPSPKPGSTTAGRSSSPCRASPSSRSTRCSARTPTARCRPSCAAPKPTTTASTHWCRGWWRRGDSRTPTTSPPSCTIVSPAPLCGLPGRGAPGRRRGSSPASSRTPKGSPTRRCTRRSPNAKPSSNNAPARSSPKRSTRASRGRPFSARGQRVGRRRGGASAGGSWPPTGIATRSPTTPRSAPRRGRMRRRSTPPAPRPPSSMRDS
jgi:conjugative relaxase-like TrwC/TraI family protein